MAEHRLVFLGPPGTGKGTQAQKICKTLNLVHLATGDLLRTAIKNETDVGKAAKSYIDSGNLVPDDVVTKLLFNEIANVFPAHHSSMSATGWNGFLLDGFPRTIPQAESLKDAVKKVILIDTPIEVIEKRLSSRRICSDTKCAGVYNLDSNPPKIAFTCDKCGAVLSQRQDDMPEVVKQRQKRYWEDTAPLIQHYKNKAILWTVDGTQSMDDLTAAIIKILTAEEAPQG